MNFDNSAMDLWNQERELLRQLEDVKQKHREAVSKLSNEDFQEYHKYVIKITTDEFNNKSRT